MSRSDTGFIGWRCYVAGLFNSSDNIPHLYGVLLVDLHHGLSEVRCVQCRGGPVPDLRFIELARRCRIFNSTFITLIEGLFEYVTSGR